ncbi:MAG: sensor histidine kinase [Chitinophagaceae bacterium]
MNIIKPAKQEWKAYFVIIPLLAFLMTYLMFEHRILSEWRLMLFAFPVVLVLASLSWWARTIIMYWLRYRFPHFSQTPKRLALLAFTHISLVTLTMAVIFFGFDSLHLFGYEFEMHQFRTGMVLAMTITLISTTFWETDYTFKRWKESLAEKEQLEQLTIRQEFETLKSQVNPHFLFNCFNTLSSLITEDKKAAEAFLNELSKVYRYLLRNNEDGMSTLENELKFVQSYYELLKTRYGAALQLQIEVDKKYESYLLPSLSLQLLIENAVKHNVVSKSSPLVIEIFTTAGHKLIVNNNLQLKPVKSPSNRIGLENIRSKYNLLSQPGFQVIADKKGFCVVLPLVWSKATDHKAMELQLNNQLKSVI